MARPPSIQQLPLRAGPAHQLRRNTILSSRRHLATYYTAPHRTLSQQLQQQGRTKFSPSQRRTFLSSFIPSPPSPNNNSNGNSNSRTLTATRTLLYPPQPLFRVISSVESYSDFLPFLTSSTVTARDPETNHPTRAYLTVGYGPLSETFTSKVDCDPSKWVVEARSGERFKDTATGNAGGNGVSTGGLSSGLGALAGFAGFPGADEGIFEYLSTRWELVPEGEPGSTGSGGQPRTTVKLEIRFEFKNQMYAKMMGAVEGQMAGIMIEAFEKRVREVHG
ncbi:dehydrase and lipid transport-domain-containing protein [Aspergillus carlsbadensis]|nr:dehydrase and lipid transport-domain-containing protein [Aspergillus carlsbadensis]